MTSFTSPLCNPQSRGTTHDVMKQPKLLPRKRRKLTAYEVRKITRRRHITWQRLGGQYNVQFPYEKSGALPGEGDRIVPNARDLVNAYLGNNLRDESDFFVEEVSSIQSMDSDETSVNQLEELTQTQQTQKNSRRHPIVIIQALWRGAIIRKKVSRALSYEQRRRGQLRRYSKRRAEIENAKAAYRRLFKAATLMQKYVRGFRARQMYRKKFATHFGLYALRIQQLARAFLSRQEYSLRALAKKFESMVKRLNQVVSIQCWYRSMVACRILRKLQKAKHDLMFYQKHCRLQAELWSEHIICTAIFKAKRAIRKRLEENVEKFVGFIPIQAHYRGWKARMAYKQMLIDIEDKKILRWNSAIKIQARWRVRYGKVALEQLRYNKADEAARLVWMTKAYPAERDDVVNDKGTYKLDAKTYTTAVIRKTPSKIVQDNIIESLRQKRHQIEHSNENSTYRIVETNEQDFYEWSSSSENDDEESPRYW